MSFVPLLWLMRPALAQDEPNPDEPGQDQGEGSGAGDDLFFDEDDAVIDSEDVLVSPDEAGVIESSDMGPPLTTGLVIPSEYLDESTAEQISDMLVEELHNIPDVTATDYLALRDEFDVMGSELALECAFDPVCLGRIGADAGLDEIIIGRATGANGGEISLVLDRVSVETRSVVRYRDVRTETDPNSLGDMVHNQLPYLYDLRQQEDGHVAGPTGPSDVQVALAWTSLGLGVAALGVGIYFGISANGKEDDVVGAPFVDGESEVLDMTQVQADQTLADAEDQALLANILFGTGIALIGVSVLLFLITPGEDIDAEADETSQGPDLTPRLGAAVTADGWSVFGQIRF